MARPAAWVAALLSAGVVAAPGTWSVRAEGLSASTWVDARPFRPDLAPSPEGDRVLPLVAQPVVVRPTTRVPSFHQPVDLALPLAVPRDLARDPHRFWLLRLRLRVHAAPAASGRELKALVATASNGLVSSSVAVATRTHEGTQQVSVSASGLVGGLQRQVLPARTVTLAHENYLRTGGLREGANTVTVGISPVIGSPVRAVEVLPGSSVVSTSTAPDEVALEVPRRTLRVVLGEERAVRVRLVRRGQRPDAPLRITVGSVGRGLRVLSETTLQLPGAAGDARVPLRVRGERLGRAQLVVRATGDYNPVSAALDVVVVPEPDWSRAALLAAASMSACSCLWLVRAARRRGGTA